MLPQPPPDAPAPPPSEAAHRSKRWRNWIFGVGITAVVIMSGAISALFLKAEYRSRQHAKYRNLTQAHSNIRQLGFALCEFEINHGRFPDPYTIPLLKRAHPSNSIPLGDTSSNDFFRSLIVEGITPSEQIFYAWRPGVTHRPDDLIAGPQAIQKGECAFAYIAGPFETRHPASPLAVFPLRPGSLLFDHALCQESYAGFALVLFTDNHVQRLPVSKSGHVYLNGKDLFDPTQPFWSGKPPDVKWPE